MKKHLFPLATALLLAGTAPVFAQTAAAPAAFGYPVWLGQGPAFGARGGRDGLAFVVRQGVRRER